MMIGTVTTLTAMVMMIRVMMITQVVKDKCERKEECRIVPDNDSDGSSDSLGHFSACKK